MGRQLVYFILALVVLGLATSGPAAELTHRWSFNGDLVDSVGGQDAVIVDLGANNATLSGTEITLTGGAKGSSDYIDLPDNILSNLGNSATIEVWATQISVQNWSRIFDFGTSTTENFFMSWTSATDLNADRVEWLGPADATQNNTNAPYELGVEYHIVCVFEPGSVTWYTAPADAPDLGASKGSLEISNQLANLNDNNCWLGRSQWEDNTANASFNEFRLWTGTLTADEREKLHDQGPDGLEAGRASNPSPDDEATDVLRDLTLGWMAGEHAATHDVYLGTSAEDVNAASRADGLGVLVSQGQTGTTFDPGRLEFGQTYYWRIDEVNAAPDNTIFRGEIWSFSVEPFVYAIENVVVTSNGVSDPGMMFESIINGSGLGDDGRHSTAPEDMWVGTGPGPDESLTLQFDFDRVYKLHEMRVWNYNVLFELMLGFGLKDVTVEYTGDGAEWTVLGDFVFAQATARSDYMANTVVDFGGIPAQAVRLTANTVYGAMGKVGLSEVRFMQVPVHAREPQPAEGAVDVATDATLSWRAGREADVHEIHLGIDEQAVIDDAALVASASQNSYDATLDLSQVYYWKVVEVNDAQAIASWDGEVWSFTTADYVVVDDFESYTDDEGGRIYEFWADGWVNDTGAIVGYLEEPFAEQTIVLSGEQSMPLTYENTGGISVAQADLEFATPQDWTRAGITNLVVNYRGDIENSPAQMYVMIGDTKVSRGGAPEALAGQVWKQWNIDLASVGANLSRVASISVGVEGAGTGIVYVDDIRLYRFAPAVVEAVDPGTGDLAAHYAMEDNLSDDTGNGYDGTPVGDPFYANAIGDLGRALSLDGINDHAELPIGSLIAGLSDITVAMWVDFPDSGASWQRIFDFGTSSTEGYMFLCPSTGTSGPLRFAITPAAGADESFAEASSALATGWHHVAVTIDSASMTITVYVDGAVAAEGATETLPADLGQTTQNWLGRSQYEADAYFTGLLADFSIYSRALSEGEVRYLAGDR